jgi:hypothetical protein
LKRHIETVHEKRRDHACPHCPSAFGAKSSLKTHIQTVHEKRRDHVCGYCQGVSFGRASGLKAHIDAVHLKIKRSRVQQSPPAPNYQLRFQGSVHTVPRYQ